MSKQERLELKTDIKLLLECMDYQKGDSGAMKQALMTLSSVLQDSDVGKDIFRETNGLQNVLKLVTSSKFEEVIEAGLYCLGSAVEKNVYNQKLMSTASVFTFLHGILSATNTCSVRKKQTATFLTLCLVSNNGYGQNLLRQSSCLHDILCLIRTTLPKNMKQLRADWFEGLDGTSIELWSALVSTTCACVNNPINEENQRICATLIPYLFSLLSNQSDERIMKPILALVGLTVNGNMTNQDRVRKGGGFEIFVKKLGSLFSLGSQDVPSMVSQLLSTVDACISDNETSSRRFGELGGLKLVLRLFTETLMNDNDKTQAALTLAHAVEAYRENQRWIQEEGGMTVLIQQLTETSDEEMSKTIKYLLHMCVASDKFREDADDGGDENMNNTQILLTKMEAMKRHSDQEMLKKINELDNKLKSMEKEKSEVNMTSQDLEAPPRNMSRSRQHTERQSYVVSPSLDENSMSVSSSHSLHQDCPTPREKSLMEQLIKERVEKEKLEKLNHMLQENICSTHTSQSTYQTHKNTRRDSNNNSDSRDIRNQKDMNNNTVTLKQSSSYGISRIANNNFANNLQSRSVTDKSNEYYETDIDRHNISGSEANGHQANRSMEKHISASRGPVTRSGLRLQTISEEQQFYQPEVNNQMRLGLERRYAQRGTVELDDNNNDVAKGSTGTSADRGQQLHSWDSNQHDVIGWENSRRNQRTANLTENFPVAQMEHNETEEVLVGVPLDLSTNTEKRQQKIAVDKGENTNNLFGRKSNDAMNKAVGQSYCESYGRDIDTETETLPTGQTHNMSLRSRTLHNRHAEIQCGTPYVCNVDKQKKAGTKQVSVSNVQYSDGTSQTTPRVPIRQTGNTSVTAVEAKGGENIPSNQSEPSNRKNIVAVMDTPFVVIGDYPAFNMTTKSLKTNLETDRDNTKQSMITEDDPQKSRADAVKDMHLEKFNETIKEVETASKKSTGGLFVKPVALPPRSKTRVTPLLGSNNLIKLGWNSSFCPESTNVSKDLNNSAHGYESDSSIQSDFDLELVRNIRTIPRTVKVKNSKVVNNNALNVNRSNLGSVLQPSPKAPGKPSQVIKSQNNVKHIDKQLEERARNVAHKWTVHHSSPEHQQPIIPPRPAFSDCGTRRHILNTTPYSMMSQGLRRRRSFDDSGIQSPADILQRTSEEGSPVDSNIEGFRSSSDVSDEDDMVPNISAAVLRSSKKLLHNCSDKCPGCVGVSKTANNKTISLDSRTFNVAIETDQNTCEYHRKLRQIERQYIHQVNKAKKRKPASKVQQLAWLGDKQHERHTSKDSVYNYNSDSSHEISPFSEEELLAPCAPKRKRQRRQRLDYTRKEEENLTEGVRKFGKNWNHILLTYEFHPSRTNVDLKDKYKNLTASKRRRHSNVSDITSISGYQRTMKPFSMCELRRLNRGILKFGHNWKTILNSYAFAKERTTEDLRNKWRTIHRKDK